ncbi:hypothetical protein JCM11251_008021 [Rhodosporidiobolus azoricus]
MAPSIWRRPGTRTFQLVHRSQRDPLINDPTASDRVLKAIDKKQKRGGKDGASSYAPSEVGDFISETDDAEAAAGDAAAYGILFDDADEYDYMQHLRHVGGTADAYLVEAPVQGKQGDRKGKGKASTMGGFELNEAALAEREQRERFQLSEDALPSHPLDELSYTDVTSGKADETGLRPDLDPSIREVLEALDDDAYAADDGTGTDDEDEFWNGVMQGGVVEDVEEQEWSDEEEGDHDGVDQAARGVKKLALHGVKEGEEGEEEGSWAAVKRFKAAQGAAGGASDDEDGEEHDSEGGDTIADLKASIAKRPNRRGAPSAVGSAFSMSSSAMFRNDQLRTLDDRFDQIEKMYDDSDDDSWGGSGDEDDEDGGEYHGPPREDLEQIMDDFLSRFEVIGGKMKPVLDPLHVPDLVDPSEAGTVAANASKLDRLRQELASLDLGAEVEGEDPELTARRREKERILAIVERQNREESSKKKKDRMPMIHILEDERKDRWDCETVLSTYSNLSNHPRMLRLRDSMGKKKKTFSDASSPSVAQIKIDPKTGFPMVNGESVLDARPNARKQEEDTIMEGDEEEDEEDYEFRETVKRPRDETTSDKKARKAAVKAERASRRAEKKNTKETFNSEVKRQKRQQGRRVADGGAADIRSGQEGVKRLA